VAVSAWRALAASLGPLAALLALPGCYAANLYTTARPVPEGEQEAIVAYEYHSAENSIAHDANEPRPLKQVTRGFPMIPTAFGYRKGLGPSTDLGVSVHNAGALQLDVKYSFVNTDIQASVATPGRESFAAPQGLLLRAGAGARLNLPQALVPDVIRARMALVPEVTYLRTPTNPQNSLFTAGLGLLFIAGR